MATFEPVSEPQLERTREPHAQGVRVEGRLPGRPEGAGDRSRLGGHASSRTRSCAAAAAPASRAG